MAKARLLWREFFTSADLADLPYWAEILFAGLFVYADDDGYIRDDVTFFQNTILNRNGSRKCPNQSRIRSVLELMCARTMLEPCTFEGVSWFKVRNFSQFQPLKMKGKGKMKGWGIENPLPPQGGGSASQEEGRGRLNPRALGTNPRARAEEARARRSLEDSKGTLHRLKVAESHAAPIEDVQEMIHGLRQRKNGEAS